MKAVEISIENVDDEDELEAIVSSAGSGLKLPLGNQFDRRKRNSMLMDVVLIAGNVASTAALIKTIIEIMGLPRKKPGQSIRIKVKNSGAEEEVEITTTDVHVVSAKIEKVLGDG
jgi:hypothetical protein